MLEHRWFLSQDQQRDVPLPQAVDSYVENVLRHRPDEKSILGLDTSAIPRIDDL